MAAHSPPGRSDEPSPPRGSGHPDQLRASQADGADQAHGSPPDRFDPTGGGPRVTDERLAALHPKLLEILTERIGRPGETEVTSDGLWIIFDINEPR